MEENMTYLRIFGKAKAGKRLTSIGHTSQAPAHVRCLETVSILKGNVILTIKTEADQNLFSQSVLEIKIDEMEP